MKPIKRWQEPIYALGSFGPGFMYQIVMTYLLYFYAAGTQPGGDRRTGPGTRRCVCCRDADRPNSGWRGGYSHRHLDG